MAFKTLFNDDVNIMQQAYQNKEFNRYREGIGNDIDDDQQPGALASSNETSKIVTVFLRRVPSNFTVEGILEMCRTFGKVMDARRYQNDMCFVNCPTISDAAQVIRGINDNKGKMFDIEASFKKEKKKDSAPSTVGQVHQSPPNNDTRKNRGIDWNNRTIKGPFGNPHHQKMQPIPPLMTLDDYQDSDLQRMDPNMDFCVKETSNNFHNSRVPNKNMASGRALYKEDPDFLNKMKNLSANSQGSYNPAKDEYFKESATNPMLYSNNKCLLCNKLATYQCERCEDFYCSVECQKKDFSRHRYICFPLPKLKETTFQAPMMNNLANQGNVSSNFAQHSQGSSRNAMELPNGNKSSINDRNSNTSRTNPNNSGNRKSFERNDGSSNNSNRPNNDNVSRRNENKQHEVTNKNNNSDKPQKHRNRRSNEGNKSNDNKNNTAKDEASTRGHNKSNGSDNKSVKKNYKSSEMSDSKSSVSNKSSKTDEVLTKKPASKEENHLKKDNKSQNDKIATLIFPKSNTNVNIVSIVDHRNFYVRSIEKNDDVNYAKILNDIAEYARQAKPLQTLPTKSSVILSKFDGDDEYYRAIVIRVQDPDNIHVAYPDFGNVQKTTLKNLKELRGDLRELPRYAHKITLADVPELMLNDKTMEYLQMMVENQTSLKIVYAETIFTKDNKFDFIDNNTKLSIVKKLKELNEIHVATEKDDIIFSSDLKFHNLVGKNIDAVILDNSLLLMGFVSCLKMEHVKEHDNLYQKVQEYCLNLKENESYTPRTNEICLVLFEEDNSWYRAQCLEVAGDGHPTVTFIDYGNNYVASIEKIRKLPSDLNSPCCTVSCQIKGAQDPTAETASILKSLLPVNDVIKIKEAVDIGENGDIMSLVNIPFITEALQKTP